jgi:pimeloyl-ACP methyl ester carboxylesterase
MRVLIPIGAVLVMAGMGGALTAWYGFDQPQTRLLFVAPLAGLALAIGLVCVGIGMGNWTRPIPSDVRPANPWSDQPAEHGDPPKGLV